MTSTSTSKNRGPLHAALTNVPSQFRDRIVRTYLELKQRHRESRLDAAGLSAGKFCEAVLRLEQHQLTGKSIPFGQAIPNFADECRAIIQLPKTAGTESERIVIPRALVFLYTLRNKRGIGHLGGDVDANPIDLATIARTADWIMCELIRIHHNLSLEDAQALVDALSIRELPDVWEVAGKKRILRSDLDFKQQVLLLCYQDPQTALFEEDLFEWTEYSNANVFRQSVLLPLHRDRLVEYDKETQMVHISPLGVDHVERIILGSKTQVK